MLAYTLGALEPAVSGAGGAACCAGVLELATTVAMVKERTRRGQRGSECQVGGDCRKVRTRTVRGLPQLRESRGQGPPTLN